MRCVDFGQLALLDLSHAIFPFFHLAIVQVSWAESVLAPSYISFKWGGLCDLFPHQLVDIFYLLEARLVAVLGEAQHFQFLSTRVELVFRADESSE